MRRRGASGDSDNLELLLDTMCNAFGGVMFIALLLAVLSQFAEVKSSPAVAHQRRIEVRALQSEVEGLRAQAEQQRQLVDMLTGDSALAEELMGLKGRNAELEAELGSLEEELKGIRQGIAELGTRQGSLAHENEDLVDRIAAIEEKIEELKRVETRKVEGGQEGVTTKPTFWLMVKWQRLYLLRVPKAGNPLEDVNTADVRHGVGRGQGGVVLDEFEAIQGKGIPLGDPEWKTASLVQKLLQHASPQGFCLQVAVYPDSYAEFLEMRKYLRDEKHYEYNWHVMPAADTRLTLRQTTEPIKVLR